MSSTWSYHNADGDKRFGFRFVLTDPSPNQTVSAVAAAGLASRSDAVKLGRAWRDLLGRPDHADPAFTSDRDALIKRTQWFGEKAEAGLA